MRLYKLNSFILTLLILCLLITAITYGQDSTQKFVDLNKLSLDTDSYCYLGQGEFMSLRSCHIPWICLQDEVCTFDNEDSVLHIAGSLYDCMQDTDFSKMSFQVLIGKFGQSCNEEPVDSMEMVYSGPKGDVSTGIYISNVNACLDSWEQYSTVGCKDITLDVKVTPGSFLFIVPAEPDSNSSYELVSAAIYNIGKLIYLEDD